MMYILIPATFIVWGLIIYRIMNGLNTENDNPRQYATTAVMDNQLFSDTFSIHPSYRDPFLGKVMVKKSETHEIKKDVTPAVVQTVQWPSIVYGGTIKNAKLNREMTMIQINGQDYMMKTGETINGIKLLATFKDSIEVSFSNGKKFIHK